MWDSRPSHCWSSFLSATVKRPCLRTGIPVRAQRCAVAGGSPRKPAIDVQPWRSVAFWGFAGLDLLLAEVTANEKQFKRISHKGIRLSNALAPQNYDFQLGFSIEHGIMIWLWCYSGPR